MMASVKKFLPAVLAAILIPAAMLLAPVKAYADVMPDPVDDQFYEEHYSECTGCGQGYIVNGPTENVEFYRSPESSKAVKEYKNGNEITIEVIYTAPDGTQWGAKRYRDDSGEHYGWVPMAYLWRIYDTAYFSEDYADDIESAEQKYTAADAIKQGSQDGTVMLYSYPGSTDCSETQILKDGYDISIDSVFADEQGRKWGHSMFYYCGYQDGWICMDAPAAGFEELYPDGKAPERDRRLSGTETETEIRVEGETSAAAATETTPADGNTEPETEIWIEGETPAVAVTETTPAAGNTEAETGITETSTAELPKPDVVPAIETNKRNTTKTVIITCVAVIAVAAAAVVIIAVVLKKKKNK